MKSRERMHIVWKPAHLIGISLLLLTFVPDVTIARIVRLMLFLYFVVASLEVVFIRYHLWNFEPTVPTLKRYAVITGASYGIGREMSYLLSEKKYSLVLAARSETVLERMRTEIELVNKPAEVLTCVCDLATTQGIDKLIGFVKDKELVIDILVNNVGASRTRDFLMLQETEVDELMTLNMQPMIKLTHAIVPQMVERNIGRVLNISSIAGISAIPTAALYSSSKAFVTNFSQALSYELRSTGVTVTCFCPGPVATNFSKNANLDKAVCMTFPGLAADAKNTAKIALDAMFNGEVLVYDTWLACFFAALVQSVIPGRLAACGYGAAMHEFKNVWQMIKR